MVTAHTVVLLWYASACGWMCACALAEVDLELQLADDWINLSDKKRRERKQQARFLLLSVSLLALSLVSLSAWLVIPAGALFALAFHARATSSGKAGPKPTQTLNVGSAEIAIAGPALRAALAMVVAMGCLSVALGHIAGPWITAEVHEHLLSASRLGSDNGDPSDVHSHVASRLASAADNIQNKHLRHLMHVHDVMRAHAENGTSVRRGIGHHIKTLGHVVGASAEVAKLIGKGVHHHVTNGLLNSKKVAEHHSGKKRGAAGDSAGASAGGGAEQAGAEAEMGVAEVEAEGSGAHTLRAGSGGDGAGTRGPRKLQPAHKYRPGRERRGSAGGEGDSREAGQGASDEAVGREAGQGGAVEPEAADAAAGHADSEGGDDAGAAAAEAAPDAEGEAAEASEASPGDAEAGDTAESEPSENEAGEAPGETAAAESAEGAAAGAEGAGDEPPPEGDREV